MNIVEAADDKILAKTIARYGRVDLLCIDELGYMELDKRGAELLFKVLTERVEKNSVAIASNDSFSGWTKTFTDARLCAAIVDRLTFGGDIIETGTDSYRLAHTEAKKLPQAELTTYPLAEHGSSPGSVLFIMRKRAFGQRREVVEADIPKGLDKQGRVGVGIIYSCGELHSHFFGVSDQAGYRRLSQAAEGSTQHLGVHRPLRQGLSLNGGPGLGICQW